MQENTSSPVAATVLKKLQDVVIVRDFTTREAKQSEDGEIELAFVSDKPVMHWFGYLELSFDAKSIRDDRLRQGLSVLLDHDPCKQVGITTSYSIGKDGLMRARVKFSRSQTAQEIVQDVADGIRRYVSVGFIVHDLKLTKTENGIDYYRSDDWEPYEISIVSIPADISVGVGRSFKYLMAEQGPQLKPASAAETRDLENNTMADNAQTQPQAVVNDGISATTQLRELNEWAEVLSAKDELRDYLLTADEPNLTDFKAYVRNLKAHSKGKEAAHAAVKESASFYEPAHSIRRYGPLKAFTGSEGDRDAYRVGRFLQAALFKNPAAIQYCRDAGIPLTRAQSANTNEAGGYLVPQEMENAIINLRNQYGVFRANAKIVPMTTEIKRHPRQTGGLTSYPVAAGAATTESQRSFDEIELKARKWGVLTKVDNELREDAIINFADDFAVEAAYAFSKAEDLAGFNGDGTSQYHGIVGVRSALRAVDPSVSNIAGLQTTGNSYSAITLNDIVNLVGRLAPYAMQSSNVKFYCSQLFWGAVLQRLALAQGGVTKAEVVASPMTAQFLGFPVVVTQAMPSVYAANQICLLFGDLGMSTLFGDRAGITVASSDSDGDDFKLDRIAIRATERFDIVVHDVGGTTEAGSIVGLITT